MSNTYIFNSLQRDIISKINKELLENIFEERSCSLCTHNKFKKIANYDRYKIKYYTGICENCGLMQQYKYPNQKFIDKFYTNYYNDLYGFFKNPKDRFDSQYSSASYKFKLIKDFLPEKMNNKLLEIGCGAGGILSYFRSKGFDCYGMDYQNDHLDYAKNKKIKTYNSLNKINNKFDIIILSHVIEHMTSFKEIFAKCKLLLNKNGIIYIEVPSIESIPSHYDYTLLNFLHIGHVTHFTKKTFTNFLNLHGFKINYINNVIHAIVTPFETNTTIINNYKNTESILRIIQLKKILFRPFKLIIQKVKKYIKKFVNS